jgi:very-short-patch-repair endonuclease
LDFYLPDYNIAIECQGIQHFKPVDFANKGLAWANNEFNKNLKRDKRKNKLCKENGIQILYFSNEEYPGMITELNDLKNKLRSSMMMYDDMEELLS